jgi:hypothetical protein
MPLKGEKDIFAIAHTSSGLMYSYTIDVAVSMARKLGHKAYICFQEPEGKFRKIVQENADQTIQDLNLKNILLKPA